MSISSNIIIRYDGPILADHRMDISDLAPALIGISELCKIANKKFNGNKSSVKVLMKADIEQKCIELDLYVEMVSAWDAIKSLIADDNIKSAKEFLEWIGIISGSAGVYGLLKLITATKGKAITSTELVVKDGKNIAQISIKGDNNTVTNIYTYPQTLELMRDEVAISNLKKVISPLVKDGYEKLEFDDRNNIESVYKLDAATIADFDAINPGVYRAGNRLASS